MWIYPVGKAQAWKEVTEPYGGWVIAVVRDGAGCMGSAAHSWAPHGWDLKSRVMCVSLLKEVEWRHVHEIDCASRKES